MQTKINLLHFIGISDDQYAYLNISKGEALRRFLEARPELAPIMTLDDVKTFEFTDEFCTAGVWLDEIQAEQVARAKR